MCPSPLLGSGNCVVTDKSVRIAPVLPSNLDGGSDLKEWRWVLDCMKDSVQRI